MLNQQQTAWTVYSVVFILLIVLLGTRCWRNNLLLLPFIVFSLLSLVAHIIMLVRHYDADTVIAWADRSVVINHMPIFSVLLFAGLAEVQRVYITQHEENHRRRRWQVLLLVSLFVLYAALTVALICVRLLQDDNAPYVRMQLAFCVTALAVLCAINALWLLVTRRVPVLLQAMALLLTITMAGMALESWLFYTMIETRGGYLLSMIDWTLLETFMVYAPLFSFLGLALWPKQLHYLDRHKGWINTGNTSTLSLPAHLKRVVRSRSADPADSIQSPR